ncbi:MAG: UDP-N-acetylmuramoyl-tripeptide--D-alanyl-D-alanine ligase [Bacilli bacterium]|nr:UDP-N-acetylmuramoyl-tripeptide--D-alanyl-D-alanine ligase [Bacilli bacterium]
MKLSVKKIIEICNGDLYCGADTVICSNYVKDTRILNIGDTYIGFKGDNFNGNHFYVDAFNKGANCVIIEKKYFKVENNFSYDKPIILVKDSLKAIRDIAIYIRNNSKASFVGVTGSVGKTSTRDMIYSVLKEEFKTLKTDSNANNQIGLPLTLMRLNDEQVGVIEMGMNHLGEIEYLSNIAKPHIGVITNIGTAHIGELGSRENILKAKLEIKNGMPSDGKLVINNDNDLLHEYYLKNNRNIITIGIDNDSDFLATDIEAYPNYSIFNIKYLEKKYPIYCPIPGKAFIYNSLIAFAVAYLFNIPTEKIILGIKNFELTKNRMEIIDLKNKIKLINGVYNASVDSMKSSLEVLKNQEGMRKIAVLGSMLELGEFANKLHEEVGEAVVNNNIDVLITVGPLANSISSKAISLGMPKQNVHILNNNVEAIDLLKNIIEPNDTILFKASNGLNFKEILDCLISYINNI